jgi:hypothetical protein
LLICGCLRRLRWSTRRRTTSPSSESRRCESAAYHLSSYRVPTVVHRRFFVATAYACSCARHYLVQAPVRFLQMGPHMQVPHRRRPPGEEQSG